MIDDVDKRILRAVQQDSRLSVAQLGAEVGLSASACHRRLKLLEERGLITGYGAFVDREALGYALMFMVEATLQSQGERHQRDFETAVARIDEVLECYLMAGEIDYIMRVVASDVADFERIHRNKLAKLPHLARLQSHLAIREVRNVRGVPIR